jgi:hypothetical protein
VRYEVDESSGEVTLIEYFPAAKDNKLRCSKRARSTSQKKYNLSNSSVVPREREIKGKTDRRKAINSIAAPPLGGRKRRVSSAPRNGA